ncbi:MAG: Flp pilus assembly protein CpaB [Bradymonadales bacterium]|nr:MAG: Flp pilus assembly protein CpaB [Bradymonadales bacterium]
MENRRAIIWSVSAAIVAAFAYYLAVNKAVDNRIGDLDRTVNVLVARRDIPRDAEIDQSMLERRAFPIAFAHDEMARTEREVVGQVALATFRAGEPIFRNKLVPADEVAINRRIPEGHRAVSIGIRDPQDVIGVGGLLRPGHFVDILVTMFVNTQEIESGDRSAQIIIDEARRLKAETRTIFQNVRILSVGRDFRLETANVSRAQGPGFQSSQQTNITVALPPADVQKLVLAQQVGQIMIALRRFNETEIVDLDFLDPFRAFGIQLPVVSGPPPAYREIRGGQVVAAPF